MKALKFIVKQLYILLLATIFSYAIIMVNLYNTAEMIKRSTGMLAYIVMQSCAAPTKGA